MFADPAYVDTALDASGEMHTLRTAIQAKGETVTTFTGITAADFSNALAGADLLVIPDLENGDLGAALSAAAKAVISNFVAAGRCLILNGSYFGTDESFANQVFGYAVVTSGDRSFVPTTNTGAGAGTVFAGAPAVLPGNDGHYPWLRASLPAGASSFYEQFAGGTTNTSVAILPVGAGRIIFLAYDWFNAVPVGGQDGGWDEILARALNACGGCQLEDDLDPTVDLAMWIDIQGGRTNSGAGFLSGNALYFADAGTRLARTETANLTADSVVRFSFRAGDGSAGWGTSVVGAETAFEFTTNNGGTYTTILVLSNSVVANWTNVVVSLPAGARTANTQLRWRQLAHRGLGFDAWALDQVCLGLGALAAGPEITVLGTNRAVIWNGDTTPTNTDGTAFGNVPWGGAAVDHTFSVTNVGSATLSNFSATVTGAPAGVFTVMSYPATLGPGAAGGLVVRFTPSQVGFFTGSVLLVNNDLTEPLFTFAVNARVPAATYFTELFSASDNDLDNLSATFTPVPSPDGYDVCLAPASAFPTAPGGGTTLGLGDDSSAQINLTNGAQVTLYGISYTSVFVNANGNLTFGAGDSTFTETLASHFMRPRIAALFDDLYPPYGGSISWKQTADRLAVTFDQVREIGFPSNLTSFQFELFFDGRIRLTWLGIANTGGLAGLSDGGGLPSPFTETNISALPSCCMAGDDFDPDVDFSFWAAITNGVTNRLAGVLDRNALKFDTGTVRSATTVPLSVGAGDVLRFAFRAGDGSVGWDVSEAGDDTVVEFSTNGVAFTELRRLTNSALPRWTNVTVTLPGAAYTTQTVFRWRQLANNGTGADAWALDNICLGSGGVLGGAEMLVLGTNGLLVANGDVTPSTIDGTGFGPVPVAGGFADHTLFVTNFGTEDLSVSPQVLGPQAAAFTVLSYPAFVVPGGRSNLVVRFDPLVYGAHTATLSLANNDSGEGAYDVAVGGFGGSPGRVALFHDPAYVDTVANPDGEPWNERPAIEGKGYTVNAFTGITAAAFAGALASADYLVIPELENGNLGAALSAAAKAVVSNFVAAGHCLIINGANGWDTNFVNQVFGHTVSAAGSFLGIASTGTAARAATAFAGGPAVLPANNAVWLWLRASLPAGAVSVYELTNAATAYTSVAILPEGRGRVIFLAYDWYDAVPGGTQDGGWDQTLGLALSQCGATDLIDSDGDGLPNWWEILHGLDPSDNGSGDPNQGAAGDPDGDDQTNLEEFYAGTDPRDPNSVFEILVHKPGTGTVVAGSRPVEITIPTVSGRTYSVWFQDDLLAPGGIWKSFRNVANGAGTWHEASPAGFRTFVDDYTTNSSGGLPPMRLRNYRAQIGNVPTTATRRVVGYYDMGLGQGSGSQVAPITTAGHLAQNVTDLTPAVLAGLDVLFVQNPDNLAFGAEYTSNLANLASAVASGMVLVIHDRCVSNAQTILPGGGGIAIVRAVTPPDDADINVSAVGNLVINGPGGIVGNATLDGGFSSSHGYATVPTLPPWAITILTRPNPAQAVTFAYPYGFGWVVYSTIPLDAYLGGGSSFSLIYAPNVVAYGAFLAP